METKFELRFYDNNINGDPLLRHFTDSVNEVAISKNRLYVRFNDMYYDDVTTSDLLNNEKLNISKIELVSFDSFGNIIDTKTFNGHVVDVVDFSHGYNTQSRFDKILLVYEFDIHDLLC